MSLITHEEWYGFSNYHEFRNYIIKRHENLALATRADNGSVSSNDLDAYSDSQSIGIGYGFDLLVRSNTDINEYLSGVGRTDNFLSSEDGAILDEARAVYAQWTGVDSDYRDTDPELRQYLNNIAASLGINNNNGHPP